jgi:hypothetical protein
MKPLILVVFCLSGCIWIFGWGPTVFGIALGLFVAHFAVKAVLS